jgi:hypothetical protein
MFELFKPFLKNDIVLANLLFTLGIVILLLTVVWKINPRKKNNQR